MAQDVIRDLYHVLTARKNADPEKSYAAALYQKGTAHIGAKILEEAQEMIDEALAGDPPRLAEESADLLFHVMVLWAREELDPDSVFDILRRRQGIGGHEEKAARIASAQNEESS